MGNKNLQACKKINQANSKHKHTERAIQLELHVVKGREKMHFSHFSKLIKLIML